MLINSNNEKQQQQCCYSVRCVWFWRGKQFQFQFLNKLNTWLHLSCHIMILFAMLSVYICECAADMEERTQFFKNSFYLLFGENKILMSCECAECIMESSFMAEPFDSLLFWVYAPQVETGLVVETLFEEVAWSTLWTWRWVFFVIEECLLLGLVRPDCIQIFCSFCFADKSNLWELVLTCFCSAEFPFHWSHLMFSERQFTRQNREPQQAVREDGRKWNLAHISGCLPWC